MRRHFKTQQKSTRLTDFNGMQTILRRSDESVEYAVYPLVACFRGHNFCSDQGNKRLELREFVGCILLSVCPICVWQEHDKD